MTLRKRKHSIDDNGTDLPGIIEDESKLIKNGVNTLSSPYEVNYIKNIQALNDKLYGDLIVEIKEINEKEMDNYTDELVDNLFSRFCLGK